MTKVIKIEGMNCMHCVGAVKKALSGIEGVKDITVDLQAKKAMVEAINVSDDVLKEVVEDAGYDVIEIN